MISNPVADGTLIGDGSSERQVKEGTQALGFQPIITLRGLLVLLLLVYLFIGPVWSENDIVASVLLASLLGILGLITLVTVAKGISLRRSFDLKLYLNPHSNSPTGEIFSGAPTDLVISSGPVRVFPFFLLSVDLSLSKIRIPITQFVGSSKMARTVKHTIVFPHRGMWKVERVALSFGDQLGLSSFNWKLTHAQETTFRVLPPASIADEVPVLSSSHRSGEAVQHTQDRLGEPFDLKQYHPSDGLKKILWKVYARTGELISRHPENSMTPEGQVILFCFADPSEDYVCADALSYVEKLRNLDLEVFFGCEGARTVASDRSGAEVLVIQNVWGTGPTEQALLDFNSFLLAREKLLSGTRIVRLVIFCGSARLQRLEGQKLFTKVGEMLTGLGIKPVFVVRKDRLQGGSARAKSGGALMRAISRAFIVETKEVGAPSEVNINEFVGVCSRNGWDILL